MIKDIAIGQYYPTGSVIHALDPRTKLKAVFFYIIALFTVTNLAGYAVALCLIALVVGVSKIPVKYVLRGLRPLIFIILFTVIINMILTPGDPVFEIWIIRITDQGLHMAIKMACRLILLITGTSMLTLSTSTIDLTDGLESLMRKVPLVRRVAHEMSMMMSIALRFIPTLMDESDRIMKAQKSRGADFESGRFMSRAKAFIPILVPLFVSAFQRANELAMAMESRCYHGGEGRTKMKVLAYAKTDRVSTLILFAACAAMFATRYLPLTW